MTRDTSPREKRANDDETGTCPVCGWTYLREEHTPENPSEDHPPDSPGTFYVHRMVSTGNGRVEWSGCTEYENGETDSWTPPWTEGGADLARVHEAMNAAYKILTGEADELDARRPHRHEYLYEVAETLRYRGRRTKHALDTELSCVPNDAHLTLAGRPLLPAERAALYTAVDQLNPDTIPRRVRTPVTGDVIEHNHVESGLGVVRSILAGERGDRF